MTENGHSVNFNKVAVMLNSTGAFGNEMEFLENLSFLISAYEKAANTKVDKKKVIDLKKLKTESQLVRAVNEQFFIREDKSIEPTIVKENNEKEIEKTSWVEKKLK